MTLRIGSLCSGYEGLGTAVQSVLGGELAWVADNDPGASKILAHHWPNVPNLGDITDVDWKELRHSMDSRRKDDKAARMYQRYQEGLSLAKVGKEFGATRQSVYGLFSARGWPLRGRPPARETVEWNGQTYSRRNTGYFGATSGDRQLLHRAVWKHHNGPIPDGHDIHHRDHDKSNNDVSNLECLPKDLHAHLYNLGCNGTVHYCAKSEEVVAPESPAIDILTAGFPLGRAKTSPMPAVERDSDPALAQASGPTSLTRSESCDPDWSSLRTSRDCSAPEPIASWNPARGVWETQQTNLLCEHSELYSQIWPKQGSMRNGQLFLPRMSGQPTGAAESSSSPGLLKTPTAQLAINGGSQHPEIRRGGGSWAHAR